MVSQPTSVIPTHSHELPTRTTKGEKTDAGNGSYGICGVIDGCQRPPALTPSLPVDSLHSPFGLLSAVYRPTVGCVALRVRLRRISPVGAIAAGVALRVAFGKLCRLMRVPRSHLAGNLRCHLPLPNALRLAHEQEARGFVLGFLVFEVGIRVGDDASAGVEVDAVVLADGCADGDVEEAFAIKTEAADGAGIEAAGVGLEFGDDLGGALFGGTCDGAAGETGAEGGAVADVGGELADDGGDEVENLRVGFDFPEFGDLDAAEFADLTEVVALEVGDHEELGAFFGGGEQIGAGGGVAGGILGKAGAGAFDGAGDDAAVAEAEEEFGGGGKDLGAVEVEVGGVWGGGDGAEVEVAGEGVGVGRPGGAPGVGEVDLIDVTGGDVIFGGLDAGGVGFLGGLGSEMEGGGWSGGGGGVEGKVVGEVAGFEPGGGVVNVKEGVGVVAEGEVAVIADPAEEAGGGEGPVGVVRLGVALKEGFDLVPIVFEGAGEDFEGGGGEEGDGARAGLRAVEPDEAGEAGEVVGEGFGWDFPRTLGKGCGGAFRSIGAGGDLLEARTVSH